MEKIVYKRLTDLHPYAKNPRKNKAAVDPVAASIKEYGFRSPLQITPGGEIINGHTRYQAAQKLGLKEVPCVVVDDLTPEQVKAYRLVDNKSAEYASWDADLLAGELAEIDLSTLDFHFDFDADARKRRAWQETKEKCDLKLYLRNFSVEGSYCACLFRASKTGMLLADIKVPQFVPLFKETAADYIVRALGHNISGGGWCLMTTPRRRHKEDFHFATAVCQGIAEELSIPFYPDAMTARTRNRLDPEFELVTVPKEKNVILYDDVITTGKTVAAALALLYDAGCVVYQVISIYNH